MNQDLHTLFGRVLATYPPTLQSEDFAFSRADVVLDGEPPQAFFPPTFGDFARKAHPQLFVEGEHDAIDAPWLRARVEHTFSCVQSDKDVTYITRLAHRELSERGCLAFSFVAVTTLHDTQVAIPFTLKDHLARSDLSFGKHSGRNDRYYSMLIVRLARAFWRLLLRPPLDVPDYRDISHFMSSVAEFGMRDGKPFFAFTDEINPNHPGGEAILWCDCGYESEGIFHSWETYGCLQCRKVVFPAPIPFVYAPPCCPTCKSQLGRVDRIRLNSSSRARCPKCEANTLQLQSLFLDVNVYDPGDSTPEKGQLLHARAFIVDDMFIFDSPRLRRALAMNVAITNRVPSEIPHGYHEFRTVAVEGDQLTVEYVRELSPDEWQWFR